MPGFLKKLFERKKQNYRELVSRGAMIVDVRSAVEYRSGHIPGSRNYPLDEIRNRIEDLKKANQPVITVCRSGTRSGIAKNILRSAGIEAYNGGSWDSLLRKIA